MKYRKKPVVIEAFRIEAGSRVQQWFMDAHKAGIVRPAVAGQEIMRADQPVLIEGKHGQVQANPGDWIIKAAEDDIYPCTHEMFEEIYEPAEAGFDIAAVRMTIRLPDDTEHTIAMSNTAASPTASR